MISHSRCVFISPCFAPVRSQYKLRNAPVGSFYLADLRLPEEKKQGLGAKKKQVNAGHSRVQTHKHRATLWEEKRTAQNTYTSTNKRRHFGFRFGKQKDIDCGAVVGLWCVFVCVCLWGMKRETRTHTQT